MSTKVKRQPETAFDALIEENLAVFKTLYNRAEWNKTTKRSPLACASENSWFEAFPFLVEEMGENVNEVDTGGNTALHAARDAETIEYLCKHGANPNIQNNDGQTPIHIDMDYQADLIEALLKHGADPEIKDEDDNDAYHYLSKPFAGRVRRMYETIKKDKARAEKDAKDEQEEEETSSKRSKLSDEEDSDEGEEDSEKEEEEEENDE